MSLYVNSLSSLNRTQSAVNQSIQKIASGTQYPSASYGPSAYAVLTRMYSNVDTISQSNSNAQNSNAMLSTASGGVSSTVDALSSLKEKLLSAANGTNQGSDIQAISGEVNQTVSQISDNAAVQFNGQNLLNGSKSLTVAGDNGYTKINLGNMTAQGLGLVDQNGKSTLDLSSSEGISKAIDTVSSALDIALGQATSIGTAQQGLAYSSANYITQAENLTAAASTTGDTDIASEVSKLKSAQTQDAFSLYATKLNMHNNAAVLSLLQ